MNLPFEIENDAENRITSDPEWQDGAQWGEPRPGHPEGAVAAHIAEVLRNVDRYAIDRDDRYRLRLVALVHDTFKNQVDKEKPRIGQNHHAMIARRFAERHVDDLELLEVVELHDEAYNSWATGARSGDWRKAEERAQGLIARLGKALPFYLRFYRADNQTGSKSQEPVEWFEEFLRLRSLSFAGLRNRPESSSPSPA
jgi:hypothetical protein